MEEVAEDARKGKVITMCDFAQKMLQQGKQEGVLEGRLEGEALVVNAILALKSGKTIDELTDTYSEHTLALAQQCI